jgi:rRNA maturation endonuclease Nob1
MAKSVSTECTACGEKFRVTSASTEPVAYCPYCGDPAVLPDSAEDELDDDDSDDLREFNPDDQE